MGRGDSMMHKNDKVTVTKNPTLPWDLSSLWLWKLCYGHTNAVDVALPKNAPDTVSYMPHLLSLLRRTGIPLNNGVPPLLIENALNSTVPLLVSVFDVFIEPKYILLVIPETVDPANE